MQQRMFGDVLQRMRDAGWLSEKVTAKSNTELVADVTMGDARDTVGKARIFSLIEFGRAVHAELAAISDAARRGVSLSDCTLVCTTFPCHECARHIVAAGLARVVFIEPYPKSLVRELFADSVTLDETDEDKVVFTPFRGVAPPTFARLYRADGRKTKNGRMIEFVPTTAAPRVNPADLPYSAPIESELVIVLEALTAG
jgi:deoxycytidylate deaminase